MDDSEKTQELFNREIRSIHLFAGAGGGILGDILLGHRPVCAVEWDKYCRKIIRQRQKDGCLPWFPVFGDVRGFDGSPWRNVVDVVAGGFPCQPFSLAGNNKGENDTRNMWPDTVRVIREVEPAIAFLENVPGLLHHDYFGQILGDLAEIGFDAEWDVVSASQLGACHVRNRLWIFAWNRNKVVTDTTGNGDVGYVGHGTVHDGDGYNRGKKKKWSQDRLVPELVSGVLAPEKWRPKGQDVDPRPLFVRMDDGMANGVDRLKAVGNGQVPCVAAFAMAMLAARAGIDLEGIWKWRHIKSDNS